jgi:hypothetical protein|uniref:Uncharacterized protein n=1 Tax=viral metagenome TaxID=1070528 RepID=A0A6C0LQK1_9ZZZZ
MNLNIISNPQKIIDGNKYINVVKIVGYLAIYIICFVFIFKREQEISSFILLSIYHMFFLIFILQSMIEKSKFDIRSITGFIEGGTLIWGGMLVGAILNFVSLVLFLISYNHVYKQHKIEGDGVVPLSKNNMKKTKEFKIFFVVSTCLTLLLLMLMNMSQHIIYKIFLTLISGAVVGLTSYEVFLCNSLLELNKITVISR